MKRNHVEWLTSAAAAARLDMSLNAFTVMRHRHPDLIRAHMLCGRLRFRAVDVDKAVEAIPEAKPTSLRLVGGRK